MKKTIRKIILIALLAVDVACLFIPWWMFTGFMTFIVNGMSVVLGSIARTVVIFATYILSVILLEKKPKVFFATGLGALSMYLAVVFYNWGFRFLKMPGAYIEIIAVIGTMVAYVLMTIKALLNESPEKASKKKAAVAISLGASLAFATVISLVVSGAVKIIENNRVKDNKNSSAIAMTRPADETTEETTGETTGNKTESAKAIMEEDYVLYENALEWFFFEDRGSVAFETEMAEYEEYFTKELMEDELKQRQKEKKDDVLQDKSFPIFTEAKYSYENGPSKVYVPAYTTSYEIKYGTYNQMLKSMPEDENVRYAWSNDGKFYAAPYYWMEDSMSRDEMILSEKEKEGFHSMSVLSVDIANKKINVYDNTYSCHYCCSFNNKGQIENICISYEDINCYRAYYDFLYKNVDDKNSVAFRDFDEDGIEELMVFYVEDNPGYVIRIYEYEDGKVIKCFEDDTFNYMDIGEITEYGFLGLRGGTTSRYLVIDETFYAYEEKALWAGGSASVEYGEDNELEYYCNGKTDLKTYIEAVGNMLEANRIKETVYGRSTHSLDSEYTELFADTHGLREELEAEKEENGKNWMNAFKAFLKDNDFKELIDQPVKEGMGVFESGGEIKGFFLFDMDRDGEPELLVQKVFNSFSGTFVYKYNAKTKSVERCDMYITNVSDGMLDDDYVSEYKKCGGNGLLLYKHCPALGYRTDNGNIVTFSWNGGSQSEGIKVNEYDRNMKCVNEYSESFYYGEVFNKDFKRLEQDDKESYEAIIGNYCPFMFVEINQTNIEKYIVKNYMKSGMYSYTLEECDAAYSYETVTKQKETAQSESLIPYGCTYYQAETKITWGAGAKFPEKPGTGDIYTTADYIYKYNSWYGYGERWTNWSVEVRDTGKVQYEELLGYIAGYPVTSMYKTFFGCTEMTVSPEIPDSVQYMELTFCLCASLTEAPVIPDSVILMRDTFLCCDNLK
ncbi:MAG: hypothetical protein ACI4EN_04870 [Butyrivibrio sp.]